MITIKLHVYFTINEPRADAIIIMHDQGKEAYISRVIISLRSRSQDLLQTKILK